MVFRNIKKRAKASGGGAKTDHSREKLVSKKGSVFSFPDVEIFPALNKIGIADEHQSKYAFLGNASGPEKN